MHADWDQPGIKPPTFQLVEFGILISKLIIKIQHTLQISAVYTTIQHVWLPACVFQNPFCGLQLTVCLVLGNNRYMYQLPGMDAGEVGVYRQTKISLIRVWRMFFNWSLGFTLRHAILWNQPSRMKYSAEVYRSLESMYTDLQHAVWKVEFAN